MASMDMTEFIESPLGLLQCGLALAVPVVLGAIVNVGCGKKREPVRPAPADKSKKNASKAAASKRGDQSKSAKSKRSQSKSGKKKRETSSKSGKSNKKSLKNNSSKKSKRSTKSVDKSGKSAKSGKKSDSKSAKNKKSKLPVQSTQQPSSVVADPKTGKLIPKQPGSDKAGSLALDASAKSAATQRSVSMKQPPSATLGAVGAAGAAGAGVAAGTPYPAGALDANANVGASAMKQPPSAGAVDVNIGAGAGADRDQIKMEPAELRWTASGGLQKISLMNQSGERQAIKVKCSDNAVYRVNPVYAFVEPGQTLNVDVLRQNGSNKVDKIVFVTAKAGLEENPKNLFKPGTQSSMLVLPLVAAPPPNAQPSLATIY